jgi:hypothetical protein
MLLIHVFGVGLFFVVLVGGLLLVSSLASWLLFGSGVVSGVSLSALAVGAFASLWLFGGVLVGLMMTVWKAEHSTSNELRGGSPDAPATDSNGRAYPQAQRPSPLEHSAVHRAVFVVLMLGLILSAGVLGGTLVRLLYQWLFPPSPEAVATVAMLRMAAGEL